MLGYLLCFVLCIYTHLSFVIRYMSGECETIFRKKNLFNVFRAAEEGKGDLESGTTAMPSNSSSTLLHHIKIKDLLHFCLLMADSS